MGKTLRQEGFAMIPNSLARCGLLTPKALSIYLCLKSHAGTSNRTWLAHKTISKESNNSLSAVKSGLRELRALGLVEWKGRIRSSDGRQTSNDYILRDSAIVIRGLLQSAPQSSDAHQVEAPIEEQLLNSSSKGRAKVRNDPSPDLPATVEQIDLIESLYTEGGMHIEDHYSEVDIAQWSRLDAHELIQELKLDKWKAEAFKK